jgi:hypothetical protein
VITFTIEEMTPGDLGINHNGYNEMIGDEANIWFLADENYCALGEACCGFKNEHAACIGIHLEGEYDQPRWITPWRVEIEGRTAYVCEDCVGLISDVFPVFGIREAS